MHYGWSSHYLQTLERGNYTFQITKEESSYLAVMPMIGEVFGAIPAGIIVDLIGRKKSLIYSCMPFIASWLLIGCASSVMPMTIGRFIAGFSDGMLLTIVPMYLGEIASPKTRGLLSSLCPVSIVVGVLIEYNLGAKLALDVSAFVSILLPATFLTTFCWMPESPYYFFMNGKEEEARRSLEVLRGYENVEDDFGRISSAVKDQNDNRGKLFDLVTIKSNRKGLLICAGEYRH